MKKMMLMAMAAAAMLLTGCGGKKCYFVSQDGKLLKGGSPVMWYSEYVGSVDSLEDTEQGVKVGVKFLGEYKDRIHDGVRGQVVEDAKIWHSPFVLLSGGEDARRPVLEDEAWIPENKPKGMFEEGFAAFWDWLKQAHGVELLVVGLLLGALFLFFKFIGKIVKLVLFICIVAGLVHVGMSSSKGWSDYKQKVGETMASVQDVTNWLRQHGEKLGEVLKKLPSRE